MYTFHTFHLHGFIFSANFLVLFSAYSNAPLLAECGGIQVIIQHIILCHDNPRVNEALTQTLLYLMNEQKTRESCMPNCGIDVSHLACI